MVIGGPYFGCIFHCILKFPENYPTSPPRVFLCTPVPHPNVFGYSRRITMKHLYGKDINDSRGYVSICLDMLQPNSTSFIRKFLFVAL
jgi:ubiquitin-protein ligase